VTFSIVRLIESNRPALRQFWQSHWGDTIMVARGQIFHPDELDGFIAIDDKAWVGLITFYFKADFCELMSIDSLRPGLGIGTALINEVADLARQTAGCSTLKLITTNDNTPALRFYQKMGFELVALYRQSIKASRKLKPSIPKFGLDGIPIRDELELELRLAP
jgi:ribosomal protein S18 acetylase RimI-like enzyme